MRAILALTVMVVVALGVSAYFVNVPLLWIGIGEVIALGGIGFRATRVRQPQPLAEGVQDQATRS